jgi:hypothetical protein
MSGFGVEVGGLRAAESVAAAAYRLAWDEWRGAARAMLLSLAEMSDALGRTAADYAAREQAAVGGFDRIAS